MAQETAIRLPPLTVALDSTRTLPSATVLRGGSSLFVPRFF